MKNKIAVFDLFMRTRNENDFGIAMGIEEVIKLTDALNETPENEKRIFFSREIEELQEELIKRVKERK